MKKRKEISNKEKIAFNKILNAEAQEADDRLTKLYASITKKHDDLEGILSKDFDDNKDMKNFIKFTEAIKTITKVLKSESEDYKKKQSLIHKIKNSSDYINGDLLKRSLQQKEKAQPGKQINLYNKMLTTINELEEKQEEEEQKLKEEEKQEEEEDKKKRTTFKSAKSLLGDGSINPVIFIQNIRECLETRARLRGIPNYTEGLFNNLQLTVHTLQSEGERFSRYRGTDNKYLMINFNAERAFRIAPPPGGRVESHISINDNNDKGTPLSSHISIKLYDNTGKLIDDYKRYRTEEFGKQPRLSKANPNKILGERELPDNMKAGDFTRLKAFMRAIDLCLNKHNIDRERAFKGGKLKRTQKLKKI